MHLPIRRGVLAALAGALGLVPIAAAPAAATPPTTSCNIAYSAQITFWAMTCSQPGEPMIGGFATWRNEPIAFDGVDTPTTTVQVANYMRVSPNTEASPFAPNIEVGLYAEKTGKATQTYGPRWSELSTQGGVTKAINAGVNPTKADRRNHTYMVVRQERGDQWDVLYDFNKVGSTGHQLKVPRGNPNRIDLGLEVMGPQYVHVPDIASRMQFMSEDKAWHQVASANTAQVISLGTCGATRKPPYCFNAKMSGGTSFSQWTAGKPRKGTPTKPSLTTGSRLTAQASPLNTDRPETFNGVNQQALQQCLRDSPDECLAKVPGLAECVTGPRLCNMEAALSAPPKEAETSGPPSEEDVRQRASASFGVAPDGLTVAGPSKVAGFAAGIPDSSVWTATSSEATSGPDRHGAKFSGFRASYSAVTGQLIEACWGQTCQR
ncbi:hypothetical protein MUU72_32625 [Streptomyces sp. RS10V-4]|uniref:hypothetical protein n=1 Tax=Streptomyces rhizoryzae TaxID=2932493 RepID=UPI002002E7FE|nr:hypothetical protein [Streptomyces rhizoryzae]MCK7627785.1 hypothetical protein [Streptomyces rhizoryzae]